MRFLLILTALLPIASFAQDLQPSISMRRGGCFGTCPAYVMTVLPDETYLWNGKMYVARKGAFRGQLRAGTFKDAMRLLNDAHYLEFRDKYFSPEDGCKEFWTDLPTVIIHVQTSSASKEIQHYHGCRGFPREAELDALESQLQTIIGADKLISGR